MIGAWWNETNDTWTPCSWNNDGSFMDSTHKRALDLTTELYA